MTTASSITDFAHRQFRGALKRHRAALEQLDRLEPELARAAELCVATLKGGGKLLICGNGGSAADAQHFAAELTGHFRRERGPLSALALTTDSSALTCIGNDYAFEEVFARQVAGLVRPEDTVIGISTSGRSPNVLRALGAARNLTSTHGAADRQPAGKCSRRCGRHAGRSRRTHRPGAGDAYSAASRALRNH